MSSPKLWKGRTGSKAFILQQRIDRALWTNPIGLSAVAACRPRDTPINLEEVGCAHKPTRARNAGNEYYIGLRNRHLYQCMNSS